MPKKEKVKRVKDSRRVGANKTYGSRRKTLFTSREGKSILLLEGFQAMPVRLSVKSSMRMQKLRLLNSESLMTETAEF
jgi:hypothetical protein